MAVNLPRVAQQPGDERLAGRGQAVFVAGIGEGVGLTLEEAEVGVHARTLHAGQRFGHEGGEDPAFGRDLAYEQAERHDVVGHRERVGVAEVDLVLAGSVLVEGVLDRDPHRLEHLERVAPDVTGDVGGGQLEVGPGVERLEGLGRIAVAEQEVLHLGSDHEREPALGCRVEVSAEDLAGVALERAVVGVGDVAEHAGGPLGGITPREQLERGGIRLGQHVALLDAAESGDRGAVEVHPLLERVLQLGGADGERLQLAVDIGEPEADQPHPPLFDGAQYVVLS